MSFVGIKLLGNQQYLKIFSLCQRYISSDYNYLEKSSLSTYFFEKSLPCLPIPKLEETCQRYLEALEPLIEDQTKYEETIKLVNHFQNGIGSQLHKELISNDRANRHTSYISEPWFDMYLSARTPLPVNYNPFMAWKPDPSTEQNDPRIRVSNFIISALRFRRSLNENVLGPEIYHMNAKKSDTDFYRKIMKLSPSRYSWYASLLFKAFPLDMSQYKNLFNSTRIPLKGKDKLENYPNSNHIVFLKKGNYYTFKVIDDSGNLKSPEEIYSAVDYIWNLPDDYDRQSVGVLTTMDRDKWADCREMLIKDPMNGESLNQIDSALFAVCLDDDINFMNETKRDPLIELSHNFLHGFARIPVERRPVNRWFDKSFSLLFSSDGQCAINFEHSWGDGVAVLRLFNEIFKDSSSRKFVTPSTKTEPEVKSKVTKLKFNLNDSLKDEINSAWSQHSSAVANLDLNYRIYSRMNRSYFKKNKLSPDSMFQLAFQMAYYKISNGKTPTTYEAASTAGFKHGRTETVRSATNQTKKACALIHVGNHSKEELIQSFVDCSKKHSELTKNAAMGKGFDRHFFALKYLAGKKGLPIPELFTDPNYLHANHFTLSTSTLYGEYFSGGGFGPVVADGFGLGYGYVDQSLGVFCSSYVPAREGKQLMDAFVASLDQIGDVLEKK